MQKPTPITKEYVEYLNDLTEEEIRKITKEFSKEEKEELIAFAHSLESIGTEVHCYKEISKGDSVRHRSDNNVEGKVRRIIDYGKEDGVYFEILLSKGNGGLAAISEKDIQKL